MSNAPHILYMTTDGHKASCTGFGGNSLAPTPFMDRMAAEGIWFSDAFAVNPICSPSRCSVFTGVHPLVHQLTCHQNRAPHNLPQLSELLQDAGYYTAAAGHFEQIRNLGRGYHEQVDEATRGKLRVAYERWQTSGREDVGWDAGAMNCKPQESHSNLLTDRIMPMVEAAARSKAPTFLHVSYNDPHPPYFAPPPFDGMVDRDRVPLPPKNDGDDQPAWQKTVARDFGGDRATADDLRRLIAVYYGMMAHANEQMQRVVEKYAQQGLLENTWIIIASDHGDFAGEKGLFSHTESLYDCLLRVPLIIRPPDSVSCKRGQRVDGFVELTDLFATMLSIAECDVPDYAQGHDLIAWAKDDSRAPLRDAVFAQVGDYHGHLGSTLRGGRPKSARHPGLLESIRTADYRFTLDPDFGNEAYDLHADPDELHNLLLQPGDPPDALEGVRDRLEAFRDECAALRSKLGIVPGYRGFDKGWE